MIRLCNESRAPIMQRRTDRRAGSLMKRDAPPQTVTHRSPSISAFMNGTLGQQIQPNKSTFVPKFLVFYRRPLFLCLAVSGVRHEGLSEQLQGR